MDKGFSVKPGQKFGTSNRYHLGLILSLCLSFCPETVNSHSQTTHLKLPPQLIAQTDSRTQAQQLSDEGMQLFQEGTAESLQKAIIKWEVALPLWREVGDKAKEASTLNNIGLVYDALGGKRQALDYYKQSLALSRAVGDHTGKATILNNIGGVYDALGEKEQALDYLQQALLLSRAVGDRSGEARTLNNIGKVYSDLGEKEQALDYLQQALLLSRVVRDRSGKASILNNIGGVYNDLGEKEQALDYYQQALLLSRVVRDRSRQATNLNNIGGVYDDLGEKEQALDYYQQSLALRRTVGDRSGEAVTLNNIGLLYSDVGEKEQALNYLQQALPLWRAVGDRSGEALILNNIGHVYNALGEKKQALDYYQQALPLWRAVGDRSGEAATLNGIGSVYDALGEKKQALDYYQQALPLSQAVGYRLGEARTLNNIGVVYNALGEKKQALEYFQQSLALSRAVGDRSQEVTTLGNIATLETSRGNLQAALTPMQDSINLIEDLRTKVVSTELRQTYFSTVQDYYQFYIDLLMELHQQNPSQGYDKQAFNISERSRARTLLELLTEANANIKEGIDPQLLAQEKSLQGQLDATEKQRLEINKNPNSTPEQKTAIDQKQQNLLEQYQNLQTEIRRKSPKYADLKYPQPLTLEQVQQQILDEDTVLLQYSLGEERSYVWVVTKEGMNSYQLPSQEEIEKQAKNVLRQIKQAKNNPDAFAQAVTPFSKVILDPVKDKLTKKRILIVADGVLQYIPFAALSLPEKQQSLITNYEIVNLPSSSSLATIRNETQARKSAPKALAILADPVFSADDKRLNNGETTLSQPPTSDLGLLALNRSVRSLEDENFLPLPGTRQEAEAILKLIPENSQKTSAFGFDANLSTATNPQLSQYRIVHFATHGILNTESPELSGVVLSLVDEKGNSINGFLRLHEIFNLNLPSDLVVISACETGLGKEIKGEGLVGLTRGFMYAGSPRVLVSLWKVDDTVTAEIMTRFYRLMLEKNLAPAEALREAQLEMQTETEWKSPYYWAGFVLQGEWQ